MARLQGSDVLFRLIHSLTTEEKGYFKKFAKRHTPKQNIYLKIFDIICKQQSFEEESLKRTFKNYAVAKVYLKELLTDALLVYYRNTHPHINLLNHVQKAHLYFIKGMYAEALKTIEKAIEQSSGMELFTIERYLHRLYFEMLSPQLSSAAQAREAGDEYKRNTDSNLELEKNLTEWELTHLNVLCKLKTGDHYNRKEKTLPFDAIENTSALSTRSQLRKLFSLQYMLFMKLDRNLQDVYDNSKDYIALSSRFRKKADVSFSDIAMQYVHATNTMHLYKFEEAIEVAEEMIKSESKNRLYFPLAFVRGNLAKLNSLFHLGKVEEALELLGQIEKDFVKICLQFSNETDLRQFYLNKFTLLLAGKKYRECWLALNDLNIRNLMESSQWLYADYLFLQLMLQFNMGNYDMTKKLAKKTLSEIRKNKIDDYTFSVLLNLFKNADELNAAKLSREAFRLLQEKYASDKVLPRALFSKLNYTFWLEANFTNKTIMDLLDAKAKRLIASVR